MALGAAHWLVFLLLLEPGNLLAASYQGQLPPLGREALRIGGAALLGAAVTPPLMWLVRHRPIRGRHAWRNLAIHAGGAGLVAGVLIVVSCPLAAWLIGGPADLGEAIRDQLSRNWAVVVLGIAAFLAAVHAFELLREARSPTPPPSDPAYLSRVAVTTGRRTMMLELSEVAWIETQGNYLALHAHGRTYLVRDTLSAFLARLDPTRFARIHRRRIVALHEVEEIFTLEGGDADLRLRDGVVLRQSRNYRRAVRESL